MTRILRARYLPPREAQSPPGTLGVPSEATGPHYADRQRSRVVQKSCSSAGRPVNSSQRALDTGMLPQVFPRGIPMSGL